MTNDTLELSISQYADGTLPAGERLAVEAALVANPAARAALAEYRRLGELLAAIPSVDLDWDRLASHLSSAIDAEVDAPAVVGRIGFGAWGRWAGALAAVATVAVGVGLFARHRSPVDVAVKPTPAAVQPVIVVTGPTVDVDRGVAVAEVRVGPSPALAARDASWRYGEGVVSRPPTAVIVKR